MCSTSGRGSLLVSLALENLVAEKRSEYEVASTSSTSSIIQDHQLVESTTQHGDETKLKPDEIASDFSSELNSDQERVVADLPEFVDSDCSVADKTYINKSESSSSEDSLEAEIQNKNKKEVTRWKKSDPSQWKKNQCKKRKVEQKSPQHIDCSKCRFKCNANCLEEARISICKNYWQCDFNRQKDFILSNVKVGVPERRRQRNVNGKARSVSRQFYFVTKGVKIRVCKEFFIRTLSISKEVIDYALQNKGEGGVFVGSDKRGKKEPPNKTKPDDIEFMKNHIESFPVMESHYTRKSTQRKYLDCKLNIRKMHSLYKEECDRNQKKPVSLITYRRYFSKNYNFSFFAPKKDQCQICVQYSTSTGANRENLTEKYRSHIERKEDCNAAKIVDKERSIRDPHFVCSTFDLECVLQIPTSDVSPMYYSRKICTYNLTVYELSPPNNAFCYAWTELHGKRGSLEIGTCLFKYLQQLPEIVTEVSLFSDTCSGQNRNQNIAALLLYLVQTTHLNVIEQKFLESGHSYMEVDSMHSAIERAQKYVPVYTLQDWLSIFRLARSSGGKSKKSPYNVQQLKFSDFLDLNILAKSLLKNRLKDSSGEKVNWIKVKCFRYEKSKPGILQYRYNHTSSYKEINVYGKGRPINISHLELKRAYSKIRPITIVKKKDLIKLCNDGVIPDEFHQWYKSLPTSKDAVDRAPEPAFNDNSESESELSEVDSEVEGED